MNKLPHNCPICGNEELTVTGFYCRECDSRVEGRFVLSSPFAQLTPEQLDFLEVFVRCEGKFTRMEQELDISYPTIRSRLYEVIRALGYEPGKDEPPLEAGVPQPRLSEKERRRILESLEAGEIDYGEAMHLLGGAV